MENARIYSVSIISFTIGLKYVKFKLQVTGRTRFLHRLSRDSDFFYKPSRYSKLLDFHNSILHQYPAVPKFPPKKWLNNRSEEFINKRVRKLNIYLESVMKIVSVQFSEEIFKLVSPKKGVIIGVIGSPMTEIEKFTSLFLSFCIEEHRYSVFETSINRIPIDISLRNKIRRIHEVSIAYFGEENLDNLIQESKNRVDGIICVYEENADVALAIDNMLWGSLPCVLQHTTDKEEIVYEAFVKILEKIKH